MRREERDRSRDAERGEETRGEGKEEKDGGSGRKEGSDSLRVKQDLRWRINRPKDRVLWLYMKGPKGYI